MQILLATCGGAHMPQIARALQDRNALAGLWISEKNRTGIAPEKYRRAWIFHLAMKPFYQVASAGTIERISHAMFPLWLFWMRRQKAAPFDVAYAMPGLGTELFDLAERHGALRLMDSTSSHPTSAYGFWQRECDLYCPGASPSVPRRIFARANRELERADLIICPSTFVRDSMIYNGIAESKCAINPYGVNTSIFSPRTAVPDHPRFVCVGAIGLRKGHQYLLRAFEKVRKVLPNAQLTCVGNYFPDFRLEKPRWDGTYQHYENIPVEDLSRILRESTAFVFPSNEEGMAKAIIEAMGAGLPIIATHESGATTLVRDGVEGLIVPGRDVARLAEAMIQVATDREANERMGRAAYSRGAKANTWGDYAERVIQICTEALKKRASGVKPVL